MAKTADLFGSAIFEITEAWLGQYELQQANYSLMTLQKGDPLLLVWKGGPK